MDRLRLLFEKLGFARVETFIASGNVIFESRATAAGLERRIEAHLGSALGWEVATFLRTDAEVAEVAGHAAFSPAELRDARAYVVGFCRRPLDAEARRTIEGLRTPEDELRVNGREIYWKSRVGQGKSKFSNAVLERALRAPSTFRGVKTVVKLATKYPPAAKSR